MSEDTKRILEMLTNGKVTLEEAEKLLHALGNTADGANADAAAPSAAPADKQQPRYLRVQVNKGVNGFVPGKQVNMRIPMSLVKGGMRLGAMIPGYGDAIAEQLRKQGFDVDAAKTGGANLEAALKSLGELAIDVDDGKSRVKISSE